MNTLESPCRTIWTSSSRDCFEMGLCSVAALVTLVEICAFRHLTVVYVLQTSVEQTIHRPLRSRIFLESGVLPLFKRLCYRDSDKECVISTRDHHSTIDRSNKFNIALANCFEHALWPLSPALRLLHSRSCLDSRLLPLLPPSSFSLSLSLARYFLPSRILTRATSGFNFPLTSLSRTSLHGAFGLS